MLSVRGASTVAEENCFVTCQVALNQGVCRSFERWEAGFHKSRVCLYTVLDIYAKNVFRRSRSVVIQMHRLEGQAITSFETAAREALCLATDANRCLHQSTMSRIVWLILISVFHPLQRSNFVVSPAISFSSQ